MADDWHAPTQRAANFVVTSTVWNEETQDNITALKSAVMTDAQATDEVIHQHKVGTLANRPAAGYVGRLYTCTDLGVTYQDDGTDWNYAYHNWTKTEFFADDFIARPAADATAHLWVPYGDTGAAGINVGTTDDDRSIINLDKGTEANKKIGITTRGAVTTGFLDIDARCTTFLFEFMVRSNQTAGHVHVALVDTEPDYTSTGANNQIGVRKVGAGDWETLVRNNSANTHNDTLEVDDTDWHKCRIELVSADSVKYYWTTSESGTYGAAAQTYDLSGDTTLTAARLSIIFQIGGGAALSRTADMDNILLASQRY
jgi:hypothetical protein